jgi:IS66 C-terminal element
MRTGIIVEVSAADRNSPQKQVWRAQIVLLTAQGCGTAEIIAGSDTGGDRAAAIYTIVQTAKLNGVNPEAYLKDTLTKIAAGHPINKILQLMPWQMFPPAAAQPA